MVCKRRSHGRNKSNRGHVKPIRCMNCSRSVPKDKAIKRYRVRNIVDASAIRDITEACIYQQFVIPKTFIKEQWCISCAIHKRTIRNRSREARKDRRPPIRYQKQMIAPKPATA